MSKVSVYLNIPIIERVITIWEEVLFKRIVSVGGLVCMKKVLLESINRVETHLDVVVVVLEFQSSVSFELCLDEDSI